MIFGAFHDTPGSTLICTISFCSDLQTSKYNKRQVFLGTYLGTDSCMNHADLGMAQLGTDQISKV